MNRKIINKHNGNNQTAFNKACKAIRMGAFIRDGFTIYDYHPETNRLVISDNITTDIYEPKIIDNDLIFPFYRLVEQRYNEVTNDED